MSKVETSGLNEYKLKIDFNPKSRAATLKMAQNGTYQIKVYLTYNDVQQSIDSDNRYFLRVLLPTGEKILIENTLPPQKDSSSSSSLIFYIGPEITKYTGQLMADVAVYKPTINSVE